MFERYLPHANPARKITFRSLLSLCSISIVFYCLQRRSSLSKFIKAFVVQINCSLDGIPSILMHKIEMRLD
jgi:hypothetical protein